jgi:DNA-binding LacI/PurR family transcriptional regulator
MALSRVAVFVGDNWRLALSPVGAALTAWGTFALSKPDEYIWGVLFFGAGTVLMIIGTIFSSKLLHSNSMISQKLEKIEHDLNAKSKTNAFFLVSSLTEEWQCELNNCIVQALRARRLTCTLFAPAEYYNIGEQQAIFARLEEDHTQYCGGIVAVSTWPPDKVNELAEWASRFQKPIVFVDQDSAFKVDSVPANIGFVSVNDEEGGELAAIALIDMFDGCALKRILVMASYAKRRRQQKFSEVIHGALEHVEIVISEDNDFNREASERTATRLINESINKKQFIDAIFCTSDSIALGCLDAISRINNWCECSLPRVVSYDGVLETRHLVQCRNTPLERILIQDAKEVARTAVEQLSLRLRGRKGQDIVWVKPYIYPRQTISFKAGGSVATQKNSELA